MSVQDKPTLKSYFETGDKPTQANFEDLIDSLLGQSDGFANGGNSFGAASSIGTNDDYDLTIKAHNDNKIVVSSNSVAITDNINIASGVLVTGSNRVTARSIWPDLSNRSLGDTSAIWQNAFVATSYGTTVKILRSGGTASDSGDYLTALTSNATNTIQIGGGFSVASVAPSVLYFTGGATSLNVTASTTLVLSVNGGSTASVGTRIERSSGLTNTSLDASLLTLSNTAFSPTSGSGTVSWLRLTPTINQTGTANGTIRGIYYNPTLTSVLGTHYAWESTSGDMLVGGTGKYLLNDGGTAKVALESPTSNQLSIGSGFSNLVLPSTVYLSGSLIAGTSTSALILQTLGGSSVNNGVSVSRTTAVTSTSGLVRVLAVSSTFAPTSGNAEFNSFLINSTINQTSANGDVKLINIHPTLTRVEGNLYGLRSQIADSPTGGGTAWNIYADGTASSYFNHNILIGGIAEASSATNTLHIYTGTAPSGNITDGFTQYAADITAGNAAPHFQTENGDVIKLYKQTALTAIDSNAPNSGDGTTDTLISNMRTRINELETTLQNLGLL